MQGYKKATAQSAIMEESELDEWFNEEKEKLEERFYLEAEKDVYKAKDHFDKDYQTLIKLFQQKHDKLYDQQVRAAKMRKPIERFQAKIELKKMLTKQWINEKKLAVKKWIFDQKIKRILKDKSDL